MHIRVNDIRTLSRFIALSAFLFAILTATGCGTNIVQFYFGDLFGKGSSTTDKGAEQLAIQGMQEMEKKDYGDALKSFRQLKEKYPYSKYAILAELKIGDAHFYKKEYSDAAIAYEEFARLHPRNEVVPYVLYQIGMCHFLSFTTIDRDQGETQLAMDAFQRVIQSFPDSEYAQRAGKQLLECQKRIVAHEYFVGQFYCRREKYKAAKERLEKIAKSYPQAIEELGYGESIREMLAQCEGKIQEGDKKPSIWTRMGF